LIEADHCRQGQVRAVLLPIATSCVHGQTDSQTHRQTDKPGYKQFLLSWHHSLVCRK